MLTTDARSYFQCYNPRTFLTLTPHISLGAAYPYALGAKLGVDLIGPDAHTPVVAICGDGGFICTDISNLPLRCDSREFDVSGAETACVSDNIAELATAVQYDIPAIALVFNDNAYGNVKRAQEDNYGGRVIGTELVNPDFVALAESFGVKAARVPVAEDGGEFGSAEELGKLLVLAVGERKPWLIEIPCGPMERTY